MVLEGGRVHSKDKIIRNSILQAGYCLRNNVDVDEVDDGCIQHFVVIVVVGHGAQTEFV